MKKIYSLILTVSLFFGSTSFAKNIDFVANNYKTEFTAAYQANPNIPRGLLEAISFNMTHFNHITHQSGEMGSCIGIPKTYGVMGLTLNGENYFRNNLNLVSDLSNIPANDIINSPAQNIMAFANAFTATKNQLGITSNKVEDQISVLQTLSELPNDNLQNNFAMNTYLYGLLQFLDDDDNSGMYGFPNYSIDFEKVFGFDSYKVLASPLVTVSKEGVSSTSTNYKVANANSTMSSDYAPAIWNPAGTCNQSSRSGTAVTAITIHDVEGTYSGCISWFQNCNSSVSAHYVIRSSDGQVTQMVLESGKAWHVGSENPYTIGYEHEGYRNQTGWYTSAMYNASANLSRDICNSGYGISPLRTYNGPSCNDICTLGSCVRIKGHQHFPNQTHNDPGPNWDWYLYYNLINNAPSINTITTATGTIYDIGGASANYNNDERTVNLIAPTGATTVTVTFSAFDLEANWDYLYLYDGANTSAPLIGRYTSTNSPGTVTANSGKLLLDFRSDCATTSPGFAASWTCN